MVVLDVGCGRGILDPFPWKAVRPSRLIGLDPDPAAASNASLDQFHLMTPGNPWPVADGSVDLIVARYVLEHVDDPATFFGEVKRVLAPAGRFGFLTPNRRHPAMICSRFLNDAVKLTLLGLRSIKSEDVFPTHYRMNTPAELGGAAARAGLTIRSLAVREFQPVVYLDFSIPTFAIAWYVYCCIRYTPLEAALGCSLLGVLEKSPAV